MADDGGMRPELDQDLLDREDAAAILARRNWIKSARDPRRMGKQIPPDGDWTQLIFRAGRGFGKTKSLTEWMWWELWQAPNLIGHAIGPTIADMRGTLFEGPAGFLKVIPPECLRGGSVENAYNKSDHEVFFANGSKIRGFGATDGGAKLRGPQAHHICGDELREWDKPAGMLEQAHTNAMFGLRLPFPDGRRGRAVFATTPKPIPYLKRLYKQPGVKVVTGTSYENSHNLSDAFKKTLFANEGTKIGRVEIHAEDIDAEEGAIFQRSWFRLWPANKPLPEFAYVVMSMDTAMEEENFDAKGNKDPDYSACAILGIFNTKQVFSEAELKRMGVRSKYAAVLCDFWMERLGFPELLEKSREAYRTIYGKRPGRRADTVLIENKVSGISLRQMLRTYGVPVVPYNSRGQSKTMRAHASSPLILQGMLFVPESKLPGRQGMVREWVEPLLEQMCSFAGEGTTSYDDGVDVIVQAMLHLMEQGQFHAEPMRHKEDPDEKREREEREAMAIRDKEKREGVGSWYGQ